MTRVNITPAAGSIRYQRDRSLSVAPSHRRLIPKLRDVALAPQDKALRRRVSLSQVLNYLRIKFGHCGTEKDWVRLRYACHFSGLGSATVATHDGDFVTATNVRIWPIVAFREGSSGAMAALGGRLLMAQSV